ncbi:hypothetical protein [Holophaga foetida]|uniref:hypothetical protein n=1 Tax=Holophaga foetida TaxID=35839 RepID=UPI0002473729|nr:hypothetical protein [Holophaga foetida]
MAAMTIIDNPNITLWFHPETKIVHHQIHKYTSGSLLRDALTKGAELLEKHQACKWLSDDRLSGPVAPEDKDWNAVNWVPRVIKAGWKYWAIVTPDKVVAQMNLRRLQEEFARSGVTVKTFTDPEAAMHWLTSL